MQISSIQVGRPRTVEWKGQTFETGIFKEKVEGPIKVSGFNLAGDQQADLRVHGGKDKAVYAYALEHYDWWKSQRPETTFDIGMFGENLTISGGLFEDQLFIGDRYQMGSAQLMITQPRLPCFKLGIRFNDDSIIREFTQAGKPGVYFQIVKEGEINDGDELILLDREQSVLNVVHTAQLYTGLLKDPDLIAKALKIEGLAESMKKQFRRIAGLV